MSDLEFKVKIDGIEKLYTNIADANKQIKELTKNFIEAKASGKDFSKIVDELNQTLRVRENIRAVSSGLATYNNTITQSTQTTSNAAQALLSLNYIIRDSPYFFQNFALGVLAVGNNLNPFIDALIRMRRESEQGVPVLASLRQALSGAGGISIALSLVVTAIQSYVFWMNKQKEENEEAIPNLDGIIERLKQLKGTYEELAKVEADHDKKQQERKREIEEKRSKGPDVIPVPAGGPIVFWFYEYAQQSQRKDTKTEKFKIEEELSSTTQLYKKHFEGITEAAKKGGKGILEYAEANKLTFENVETLMKGLKDLTKEVYAVGGGIGNYVSPELKKVTEEIKLNEEAVRRAITVWEEFNKKTKPKKEEKIKPIERASVEDMFLDEDERKVYDILRDRLERMGIYFDAQLRSYFIDVAIRLTPKRKIHRFDEFIDKVQPIEEYKNKAKEKLEIEAEEILQGKLNRQLLVARNLSNILGDSLVNAFTRGKFAIEEFVSSLMLAIGKMLLLNAISSWFGLPSIFGPGRIGADGAEAAAAAMPKVNVLVGGNVKMNGQDFVIQFKRVEKNLNTNRI